MFLLEQNKMIPSYSLHTRVHKPKVSTVKKRKSRPVHLASDNYRAYKYKCYECHADVYFLPGHELVCSNCAARIVEKVAEAQQKREIYAR